MPELTYQTCFLCARGVYNPTDPSGPEIQLPVHQGPERRILFFAHEECMRRAAHPEFAFPPHEQFLGDGVDWYH